MTADTEGSSEEKWGKRRSPLPEHSSGLTEFLDAHHPQCVTDLSL